MLTDDLQQLAIIYSQIGSIVRAEYEIERAKYDVRQQGACVSASLSEERRKFLNDLMKRLDDAENALRVVSTAPAREAPPVSPRGGGAKARAFQTLNSR